MSWRQLAHASRRFYAANSSSYKVLVLGGGAGGQSVSYALSRRLEKGAVAVIEPADTHYYQPMWTWVGAGAKKFEQSKRDMESVMSKNVDWIKTSVAKFQPDQNHVITQDRRTVIHATVNTPGELKLLF
eukprot:m.14087 g.14087  ORF g.14087 m.14087 type:complete len:129 (+) comp25488_c0_seq1:93-479(+)